jgi:hypothetical protein
VRDAACPLSTRGGGAPSTNRASPRRAGGCGRTHAARARRAARGLRASGANRDLGDFGDDDFEGETRHGELGEVGELDDLVGHVREDETGELERVGERGVMQQPHVAREDRRVVARRAEDVVARDHHHVRLVEHEAAQRGHEAHAVRQARELVARDVEFLERLHVPDALHVDAPLVHVLHHARPFLHVDLVVAVVAHLRDQHHDHLLAHHAVHQPEAPPQLPRVQCAAAVHVHGPATATRALTTLWSRCAVKQQRARRGVT